jgi:hypothetical protein
MYLAGMETGDNNEIRYDAINNMAYSGWLGVKYSIFFSSMASSKSNSMKSTCQYGIAGGATVMVSMNPSMECSILIFFIINVGMHQCAYNGRATWIWVHRWCGGACIDQLILNVTLSM